MKNKYDAVSAKNRNKKSQHHISSLFHATSLSSSHHRDMNMWERRYETVVYHGCNECHWLLQCWKKKVETHHELVLQHLKDIAETISFACCNMDMFSNFIIYTVATNQILVSNIQIKTLQHPRCEKKSP